MDYVEVLVNVPVRGPFARPRSDASAPADALDDAADALDDAALDTGDDAAIGLDAAREAAYRAPDPPIPPFQTFHYHLPPELRGQVEPGHLVWVPFHGRTIQGIVVRPAASAPTRTKAVLRVARPEPVLTPAQLGLAAWIAFTYVAPIAEAVKLLLPPGLLQRDPKQLGAQPKRVPQVELVAGAAAIEAALAQAKQGGARHRLPLEILAAAGRPLWRDELYAQWQAGSANRPALLRDLAGWGLITINERVRFRDPLAGRDYRRTHAPPLTGEQAAAWATICAQGFGPQVGDGARRFLLHGVTGSGKTEIYLRAISETLAQGKQAIVLVPEIALAPQTVARFAGRFPGRVTVIHSALSNGERFDVWRALRAGEFDIVVGPRSALFAPLPNLGLIVIDEEHESTYKQDAEEWGSRAVFYDARVVARRLAAITDSVLILGSATPSLEAYAEAMRGGATLISLPQRVVGHDAPVNDAPVNGGAPPDENGAGALAARTPTAYGGLPPVEIVDMRQELRAGNRSIFSRSLQTELRATLAAGEQAILFLNRRGSSTFVMCRDCGYVAQCPRCETPLIYHEGVSQLVCHHCNLRAPIPTRCPACQSARIRYFGSGTEQIERRVREVVPGARLLRWDADTTSAKGSHEALLQRFADHEADVLVGTQMIAKGLDLPLVTLVGVVAADVGLHLPDFRAGERAFQLLTQVAGRAGRSRRGGRVVIQSYTPEHYAIQAAARHDYHAFYAREMRFRREQAYPPVRRMARLVYWAQNPQQARTECKRLAALLLAELAALDLTTETRVIGPAPAFFARSRGYARWQILLCADDPAAIVRRLDFPYGWRVDIDPVTTL